MGGSNEINELAGFSPESKQAGSLPLREEMVTNALGFLQHPKVSSLLCRGKEKEPRAEE